MFQPRDKIDGKKISTQNPLSFFETRDYYFHSGVCVLDPLRYFFFHLFLSRSKDLPPRSEKRGFFVVVGRESSPRERERENIEHVPPRIERKVSAFFKSENSERENTTEEKTVRENN